VLSRRSISAKQGSGCALTFPVFSWLDLTYKSTIKFAFLQRLEVVVLVLHESSWNEQWFWTMCLIRTLPLAERDARFIWPSWKQMACDRAVVAFLNC
jgi:hypothetical protein